MKRITIRHAVSEDIPGLYRLFSTVDQMHREAHPEIFKQVEFPDEIKEYYQSCITEPDASIILAEESNKIIGGLICTLKTTPNVPILVPRKYACIDNIAVSGPYQQHGVGRDLIETAQRWAFQRGASMVELSVWEFNQDAANFYQKLGFRTFRRRMVKDIDEGSP